MKRQPRVRDGARLQRARAGWSGPTAPARSPCSASFSARSRPTWARSRCPTDSVSATTARTWASCPGTRCWTRPSPAVASSASCTTNWRRCSTPWPTRRAPASWTPSSSGSAAIHTPEPLGNLVPTRRVLGRQCLPWCRGDSRTCQRPYAPRSAPALSPRCIARGGHAVCLSGSARERSRRVPRHACILRDPDMAAQDASRKHEATPPRPRDQLAKTFSRYGAQCVVL